MVKQIINIICIPILYNILDEIKDNLSFKIANFNNEDEFLKFSNENNTDYKKFFIITTIRKKNFFLKKNFNIKNIFFFLENNSEQNFYQNYNIFKYPIEINNLIEKINIQLIKQKYDFQSKIKLKNYSLDLNSRTITKNSKNLKLTEREMDIILFLNDSKKPQKINVLQNQVWKYLSNLETHTVETHIYRLRKKMNDNFKDDNFIISSDAGYFIK